MINRRGSLVLFWVLLLAVCGGLPVVGADDPPSTEDKKSQLALYLWATGRRANSRSTCGPQVSTVTSP